MHLARLPFFSVVVPVHNKARHVRRAINSALTQAFPDFELLLIDDASTDGSLYEMQAFDDSRIRFLHRDRPGAGGYAARNLGIREARAEWVAFLDADDEWLPGHLETLRSLIDKPHTKIVATGWMNYYEGGESRPNAFSVDKVLSKVYRLNFSDYLLEESNMKDVIWTGAVGIRRDEIAVVGGFPESCRKGGDTVAWLRVVEHSGSIHVSPKRTAVYHREASTVTKEVPPEVQGNCVHEACLELIRTQGDRSIRHLLRRFSNRHVAYGLKPRAIAGELRFADCSQHYLTGDWGPHLFYRLHSLASPRLQRWLWSQYRSAKQLRVSP